MLQPFFVQSREQPVDVAGWYKDVTTAAIHKQRRWLNIYIYVCVRAFECISLSFFFFIVSFTYLSFFSLFKFYKFLVLYHQACLGYLMENYSYFQRVLYVTRFFLFCSSVCVFFFFCFFSLCNMYIIVIRKCFYEKNKMKNSTYILLRKNNLLCIQCKLWNNRRTFVIGRWSDSHDSEMNIIRFKWFFLMLECIRKIIGWNRCRRNNYPPPLPHANQNTII